MSSPVAGFLPRRFFFFFTQNLPKPEINTSSPFSRDRLISSKTISTVSKAFLWVYPLVSTTDSTIRALVREPDFGYVGYTDFAKDIRSQYLAIISRDI